MPEFPTTPGRPGARVRVPVHVAFRGLERVGARYMKYFAAQWLAYALPCRRFAPTLASRNARLGADVIRYIFIVMDSHHLVLAGLPAHPNFFLTFAFLAGATDSGPRSRTCRE